MHRFKKNCFCLLYIKWLKLLKKHGENGVEVVVINDKKWLNETNIKDQLKQSNLAAVALQYSSELRKQRQVLKDCDNHQPCSRRFLEEDFAMKITIYCRTTPSVNFKTKLGFNQHDPIMTQEQSVLSKIVTLFAAEEIILQHNLLGYRVDAYFSKCKLAIEVDEQGHNNRDVDYEIERQKAIENKLVYEFININPAKENFKIFVKIGKIQNNIVKSTKKLTEESTKKSLIDELSSKLLRLDFKSSNSIKAKCLTL